MGYYVLGDQGQKYGPADVATLNQWVSEGRVLATTMLEDEVSGARVGASAVQGLQFAAMPNPVLGNQRQPYQQQPNQPQQPQQPYQEPYQQPGMPQQYGAYQRPMQYSGVHPADGLYKRSITMAIISMALTVALPYAGIITGILSLVNAIQAKSGGHPKATTGILVSSGAVVFYVVVHIIKLAM